MSLGYVDTGMTFITLRTSIALAAAQRERWGQSQRRRAARARPGLRVLYQTHNTHGPEIFRDGEQRPGFTLTFHKHVQSEPSMLKASAQNEVYERGPRPPRQHPAGSSRSIMCTMQAGLRID